MLIVRVFLREFMAFVDGSVLSETQAIVAKEVADMRTRRFRFCSALIVNEIVYCPEGKHSQF